MKKDFKTTVNWWNKHRVKKSMELNFILRFYYGENLIFGKLILSPITYYLSKGYLGDTGIEPVASTMWG